MAEKWRASRVKSYENASRVTRDRKRKEGRMREGGKEEKIKPCNEIRSDLEKKKKKKKASFTGRF